MSRDQVLDRLRERIVRFAASRLMREQAEDLAQEVLMVLHEKYPDLESPEDLVPLSLEIARLKIAGARRKIVRRGENTQVPVDEIVLPSGEQDPFDQAALQENLARIEAALAELGERCRDIVRWKLEGHTFIEIQKKLGAASVNTVYTWDFRCRKQLLEKLGGRWS